MASTMDIHEDYRDVRKDYWDGLRSSQPFGTFSFGELSKAKGPRPPQHGDRWGNWELDSERLVLFHTSQHGYGYEIDLEKMQTSARMLDFIFQVYHKGWHTRDDCHGLLDALYELLDPQANLCSWGVPHTIVNPEKLLRDRLSGHHGQGYSLRVQALPRSRRRGKSRRASS